MGKAGWVRAAWVKPLQRALPVAIAALLVVGLVGLGVHGDAKRVSTTAPTTLAVSPSSTGSTTTTVKADGPLVPPQLASLVAQLEAFVERARGLKFLEPVRVTLLSDKAFRKRIADQSKVDQAAVDKLTKVLRALDLIPAGTDVAKEQKQLLSGAVLGYYDPKAKALFVRGGKPTPAVRDTLVHELTHAVQDQHFHIERPDIDKKQDESSQAFSALLEGDAVRVQQAYLKSLSTKEQNQVAAEESSDVGDMSHVPRVLVEALTFPYTAGPRFVNAVLDTAGQPRLDAAFTAPPTTSEQVLHPDKFLVGEAPMPVSEPPADGTVIDRGVFGEFGFIQQLEGVIDDDNELLRDAAGWGGDRYVAWTAGSKTCVRDDVVMDTPQDADELRAGLQKWVDKHPGASLANGPVMRFTSCA
jgi:hypothetical protein